MKKRINGVLLLLMSITMLFSACSKDPETKPITTDPEVKVGDILVYTMLMNPGGQTGSGWMQLADGVSPKKLTNKNAVQVGYGMMPVCNGNDVYTFPAFGAQGDENVVTKWGRSGTKLTKTATMPIPLNSVPRHISFVNATKAYLISLIGKLFIFNPQTMELTGEIDLSSYAAPGLAVPMFGSPFVHNGRLYVTLNQTDMTFQPATEPQIELAVINTQTDKVERVIYEKASGIGIGAYTYGQQTFIDEKGDMYLMWDLVTRDYSKRLNGPQVFEKVKKYVRNGSIITFHDSLKSEKNLKYALPRSIEWLLEQGYQFKVFD